MGLCGGALRACAIGGGLGLFPILIVGAVIAGVAYVVLKKKEGTT
ncbi:MAG: hypothetical protein WCJ37_00915 [Syntrophus sp. (in: bacteria)]